MSTRAAFLTARLTDFLINDNDRHSGQLEVGSLRDAKDQWEPIARDRDHAFVSFEGALLKLRGMAMPILVKFDDTPNVPVDSRSRADSMRVFWRASRNPCGTRSLAHFRRASPIR